MSRQRIAMALVAAALCGCQSASAQAIDPPARIGRVSDVSGSVSLLPVGQTDWSAASLNYPLTTGDAVWADADGRAEIHVGSSAVRITAGTALSFDAIQDNLIQLRIGQGALKVRLRDLSQDDSYEIDTPAGAILLRSAGDYRVDVTPDGRRTTITVREGDADVQVGNETYALRQGTSVTLTGDGAAPVLNGDALAPDSWERWADGRDRREDALPATRYVSREMIGYEDLDQYGDWQVDPSYGPVWYPRSVASDWAPYRSGRWESVQPWGWTWIDEAPWGFAPFHYGRWANDRGRWGWYPGGERARPVYAPALVAFVSGDGWSASLSLGSGGGVGWVPLGRNEVYVPAYRTSPTYVRNVNITNVNVTLIDVTHVDVNTVRYANRDVPGAVTAVPRDVFRGSGDVRRAAVPVRSADLSRIRVSTEPIAAGVAIAPPPRGSQLDRARPGNAGVVRQPPVALQRTPMTPRRPDAGATPKPIGPPGQQDRGRPNAVQQPGTPPGQQDRGRPNDNKPPAIPPGQQDRGQPNAVQQPVTPPGQPDRGQRYGNQPAVTPPPTAPTIPPKQGQGRARNQQTLPTPIRPVPMPATPAAPPSRNPNPRTLPTPIRPAPTPASPATPTGRDRRQPTQPPPRPVAPTPAAPAPAVPARTPPGRDRQQPTQPAPRPVAPTPARPTPAAPAPAPQARGRGNPAPPTTPPARKGKPTAPRPDSARGHGVPPGQLLYQQ